MYIVYIDYNWIIGSNLGFFVVENSGKTEFNMINILKWYSGRVSVYVLYMHFWVIPEKCNFCELMYSWGIPRWHSGRESTCQCRRCKRCGFDPWVGKIPWNRKWQPTLVFLPGKSHEQRSLVGYSPWDHKESDTSEHACTLYTIMSCRFLQKSSLAWMIRFWTHALLTGS